MLRRQGDYARAMLACDHLVELTQAPEHRRDRGLLAHALRTFGAASEDLAAYLEARPDAKDANVISRALEEAREQADQVPVAASRYSTEPSRISAGDRAEAPPATQARAPGREIPT